MTVVEAAKQLEVTASTVYALCADGQLGHIRIGRGRGTMRIEQGDVDTFRALARAKAEKATSKEEPARPYILKHIRGQRLS